MRQNCAKLLLLALFSIAMAPGLVAQEFRRAYDLNGTSDYAFTVLSAQGGGFLMAGTSMVRTDALGDTLWVKGNYHNNDIWLESKGKLAVELPNGQFVFAASTGPNNQDMDLNLWGFAANGAFVLDRDFATPDRQEIASALVATPDGGFAILSSGLDDACSCRRAYLKKLDADGVETWEKTYDFASLWGTTSLVATSDGGYAVSGTVFSNSIDALVFKTDGAGEMVWEKTWSLAGEQFGGPMIESTGQRLLLTINSGVTSSFDQEIWLANLDLSGNEDWLKTVSGDDWFCDDMVETPQGDLALVGKGRMGFGQDSIYGGLLLLVDDEGSPIWQRVFESGLNLMTDLYFRSVSNTPDGGFVVAGNTSVFNSGNGRDMLLVKTDENGLVFINQILGKVFRDDEENCSEDPGETPLPNMIIKAAGNADFYALSRANGTYALEVPDGSYTVSATPPSPLFAACLLSYNVQAPNSGADFDFPIQPTVDCALMEVDLVAGNMRPCSTGQYYVSYCNHGTIEALGATVELVLPEELTFLSATVPLISQNGQVFLFGIGDVGIEDCGSFNLEYLVDCDPELLGQSLCAQAHAFPDSPCIPSYWNGPNITAAATCVNDSIQFTLANEGDNMPEPFGFIVIEDNVILMTDQFQLGPGLQTSFRVAAQSGATYHLVAAQADNFPPLLGNAVATSSIEACVGSVGEPGALLQLPADDGEPWLAIDCQTVVNSFDPNDKSAQPTGWLDDHLIEDRTDLEYVIRFQNTGTDLAYHVDIIDTLSLFLDPASIRPGASSHPYVFDLSGQGIAKFSFENIILPDSSSNEPASHGFVKFRIAQKPGNPIGTLLENKAAIYFDQNPPVLTNTVFHTIGSPWVGVLDSGPLQLEVLVFPNPLVSTAAFHLPGRHAGQRQFSLYDMAGRQVRREAFEGEWFVFQRDSMATGIYFFRIEEGGKQVGSGRIVVR